MDIVVPLKFVPDLVEELEIDGDSGQLDRTFLRLIPNELDDHALEQALLLKERGGGTVTVITLDFGDVDEALFTAKAKGVDRVIKITGDDFAEGVNNHAIAAVLESALKDLPCDLVLTGTQAVDDLDGFVGALLAARMGLPYVGYVTKVTAEDGKLSVMKEFPGGLNTTIEVPTPAVLGIQAAEQPPRYVVTNLLMEAMKTATIDEVDAGEFSSEGAVEVAAMAIPESGERAEMIGDDPGEVADALVKILQERGVIG